MDEKTVKGLNKGRPAYGSLLAKKAAAVLSALSASAVMGCQSSGAPQPQPVVIHLEAEGGSDAAPLLRIRNETKYLELGVRKKVDAIMKNYMDSQGEEYGYYTLNFGRWRDVIPSEEPLADLLFTIMFGVDIGDKSGFRWSGWLLIYDSQGNSIGTFNTKGEFETLLIQYATFSSTNVKQEETSGIYAELLGNIIKEALSKSAEINEQLQAAGPRNAANTTAALAKIRAQEERIEYKRGKLWIRE